MDGDGGLRRREFLEKTAYAAGLAGMTSLGANTILEAAAKEASLRSLMPSPRNLPIDHFVVLCMENRSFDHYFGWAGGAADASQHEAYRTADGKKLKTRSATKTLEDPYQGCGHPDPGHGWESGRVQYRDGFAAEGSGNDEFALTYYDQGELGFIHGAANRYTLYDRYFCSILASTFPNRYYKWSAQSGGKTNNDIPPIAATLGNQWETIFDRALSRGVSARYYYSDIPFSATWGPRGIPWTNPIARYYTDCAAGTLPNITFLDPPFGDAGGGGFGADEHPLSDVRAGQGFMADVVNAFVESPNYKRGAMFVIYDEWGGFFDHVRPPSVPDDRGTRKLDTDFGQLGFRIPALAISPWTRNKREESQASRVQHGLYGHESILKFIEYRFGLGHLVKRDARANNIGRSFNWTGKPDFDEPGLPNPSNVLNDPTCMRDDSRAASGPKVEDVGGAHYADLAELRDLAERLGFPTQVASPENVMREPDKVRKALGI